MLQEFLFHFLMIGFILSALLGTVLKRHDKDRRLRRAAAKAGVRGTLNLFNYLRK